ncbi:hypothetical protein ABZP36_010120 [Zizania latifolia]
MTSLVPLLAGSEVGDRLTPLTHGAHGLALVDAGADRGSWSHPRRLPRDRLQDVLNQEGGKDFKEKISDEYHINMILDNLPMVVLIKWLDDHEAPTIYRQSVHVGVKGQYSEEKASKEMGWKLVHGDVFQPPEQVDLLSVGRLKMAMLLVYAFMGVLVGYAVSRLYKGSGSRSGRSVVHHHDRAGAALVQHLSATGVHGELPWVQEANDEDPMRMNKIPQPISEQPWYMNLMVSVLIGRILPFGLVFIELFFTSIWLH